MVSCECTFQWRICRQSKFLMNIFIDFSLKPSAHSTIFVTEDDNFCRWRRELAVCGKHIQKIFVADDDFQYQIC